MKTLPPSLFTHEGEPAVDHYRRLFGGQTVELTMAAREAGGHASATGLAVSLGMLDAVLHHFVVYHGAKRLTLDEADLSALIAARLQRARQNVASYQFAGSSTGSVQ